MYLFECEPVLTLKEIAHFVCLSYSCVRRAVKRVNENCLRERLENATVKKGRKKKITAEMSQIVKPI